MSNYPDNFSARAFDAMWGTQTTGAELARARTTPPPPKAPESVAGRPWARTPDADLARMIETTPGNAMLDRFSRALILRSLTRERDTRLADDVAAVELGWTTP